MFFLIVCCCFQKKYRQDGRLLCSTHLYAAGFPGKTVLKRQTHFLMSYTFPPSSCEYEPLRVNSAYQCCFAAMCCAGWYYCTAETDKVETYPHFVISFKTNLIKLQAIHVLKALGFKTSSRFFNTFENRICFSFFDFKF